MSNRRDRVLNVQQEEESSLVVLKLTRNLNNNTSARSANDANFLDEDMAAESAGRIWGMNLTVRRSRGNSSSQISNNANVVKSDDDNVSVISIYSSDEEEDCKKPAAKPKSQTSDQNNLSIIIDLIEAKSVARDAGAKEGDEIVQLFGAPFSSCMQLFRSLQYAQYIEVTVKRVESAFEKSQRLRLDALLAAQKQTSQQGGKRGFRHEMLAHPAAAAITTSPCSMKDKVSEDSARQRKKRKKEVTAAEGGGRQKAKKGRSRENSDISASSACGGSQNESSKTKLNGLRADVVLSSLSSAKSRSQEGNTPRKCYPSEIILPSGWRKEVNSGGGAINFLHVPSGFRVKHSQSFIMPELLEILSKPFCVLTPKTAFKKLIKTRSKQAMRVSSAECRASSTAVDAMTQNTTTSLPRNKQCDQSPRTNKKLAVGSNISRISSGKTSGHIKSNAKLTTTSVSSVRSNRTTIVPSCKLPKISRPALKSLTGDELPLSWLPKTESKSHYTHEPTGKKIYSTYIMRIVIRLMLEIPGINIDDAIKMARTEDEEAKEEYVKHRRTDRAVVTKPHITSSGKRNKIFYNPHDLPKGWKRQQGLNGKSYFYEHIQSGIKEYSFRVVLKVPKILRRKGPKLSLMDAIKVAKEEDAKERDALISSRGTKIKPNAALPKSRAKVNKRAEYSVRPQGVHFSFQSAVVGRTKEVTGRVAESPTNVNINQSRSGVESDVDRRSTESLAEARNRLLTMQQSAGNQFKSQFSSNSGEVNMSNWV